MSYAIIKLGGKQYRVREGERLLVDRLAVEDGKTFTPNVLLVGGDGEPQLDPAGVVVTAKVLGQQRGPKIRIGKYKKRTGYRKHNGFRAALTQIEIESIGGTKARCAKPSRSGQAGDRQAGGRQAGDRQGGDCPKPETEAGAAEPSSQRRRGRSSRRVCGDDGGGDQGRGRLVGRGGARRLRSSTSGHTATARVRSRRSSPRSPRRS